MNFGRKKRTKGRVKIQENTTDLPPFEFFELCCWFLQKLQYSLMFSMRVEKIVKIIVKNDEGKEEIYCQCQQSTN